VEAKEILYYVCLCLFIELRNLQGIYLLSTYYFVSTDLLWLTNWLKLIEVV